MASLVRPVIAACLSGLLLLGPIPAWMHVATCVSACGTRGCGHQADGVGESPATAHCCIHHLEHSCGQDEGDSPSCTSADHAPQSADHESGDCLICQSLAIPGGLVDNALAVASTPLLVSGLVLWNLPGAEQDLPRSIQARGPPVRV